MTSSGERDANDVKWGKRLEISRSVSSNLGGVYL